MDEPELKPPPARAQDALRPKGSAIRGFAVGLVVDIGGTLVYSIVLGMVYASVMSSEGKNTQEIEDALSNPDPHSLIFAAGLLGGTLFSMLGGFVCERIAKRGAYRLGLTLGFGSTAAGLILGGYTAPPSMNVLLALLTVVAVLIGTNLAFDRPRA
jgi:MFS family permease